MPDDELDKLITDAANQHHPVYNDKDWDKMLGMLNRHMPEKKDRKRPFILWLIPLLLLTGILTGVLQLWKINTPPEPKNSNKTVANIQSVVNTTERKNSITPISATTAYNTLPEKNLKQTSTQKKNNSGTDVNSISVDYSKKTGVTKLKEDIYYNSKNLSLQQKSKNKITVKKPGVSIINETDDNKPVENEPEETLYNKLEKDNFITSDIEDRTTASKEKPNEKNKRHGIAVLDTTNTEKLVPASFKKLQNNKSFVSNFAIAASAGADVSFVELSQPGKTTFTYGFGAAYNAGKHIRISTGLFVTSKQYTAAPNQYKFPAGAAYPYLNKVLANCKVFEIPLNVYYNFKQHKKQNWFAGAGLSSYLMKKEDYEYQYKYPSGQWHSYYKNYSNEYKHILSVVNISGGWQYNFNKRISFISEPYFKIPLSGVGAGKVKLNSMGILLSIAVKPFQKK
jgi:hypothetical protein